MPAAAVDLDEADAALHQPPRQQALAPELLRALVVQAVQCFGLFRLLADVHDFGRVRLHPVAPVRRRRYALPGRCRRDWRADAPRSVCPAGPGWRAALPGIRPARGEVENRRAGCAEHGSLIGGGHEAARPVRRAADRPAPVVGHHDEAGQVLVLAAQSIRDPRADGRMALQDRAGVHLEQRGRVVVAVAVERAHKADVVHALRRHAGTDPRLRCPTCRTSGTRRGCASGARGCRRRTF